MKILVIVLMIGVAGGLLVAGCTTPTVPTTPTPTILSSPQPTATTPVLVTDPQLAGTWTLGEIGLRGGQGPLTLFQKPVTITFSGPGTLAGNGGCNNYGGSYTLTGASGPFGKGISIGPITTNLMYCADSSDIENWYFQILSNVSSYAIDNNATLSMRDPLGSTLVYQRT